MTVLNPYLVFSGNAREAIEFYRSALGGELTLQTFADFGAPVSPDYSGKVMHAQLEADGLVLMASDDQEGSTPVVGSNISLSLSGGPADRDRLVKAFDDLSVGGTTTMPLGEAPWGDTFGMFSDQFGVNWLVNITNS